MRRRTSPLLTLLAVSACGGDVSDPPGPDLTAVTQVVVNPTAPQLTWLGATTQLGATAVNVQGTVLGVPIAWSSSDPGVADVSASGLVTARAPGTATISALAGTTTGTALVGVTQAPAAITKISGDAQQGAAGELLAMPLVIELRDQGGAPIPGTAITWNVLSGAGALESIASLTDASGRASAQWRLGDAGTQTARAAAGAASASFAATAVSPPFSVSGVTPSLLIEGEQATLLGAGFPTGSVPARITVDGIQASILSASSTEIRFRVPVADCRPPRSVSVHLDFAGQQASTGATMAPAAVQEMDVGQGFVLEPAGCIQLGSAPAGTQYVVGVFSRTTAAASLTPARIEMQAGLAIGEMQAAAAAGAVPLHRPPGAVQRPHAQRATPVPFASLEHGELREARARAKAELWDAQREWMGRRSDLLEATVDRAADAAASVPVAGETMTLYAGGSCTASTAVTGIVRHVGEHAIWVEDTTNPAGGLTVEELTALDDTYSAHTLPTITQNFGDFADVDGNGRIIVLITRAVNAMQGVLGYVFGGDLFSQSTCPHSNQAEIFYGIAPDPNGAAGPPFSKARILELYPSLIAHEATHVLQFTNLRANKFRWEFEGGATLAEQLVGNRVYGHDHNSNLGFAAWDSGEVWYYDWVSDLAYYWGYQGASNKASLAPEQCSWVGTVSEGNSGPCFAGRAVYGVPAMLYRFTLDLHGAGYPGGSAALMRALTGSVSVGVDAIVNEIGMSSEVLLGSFYAGLWADGRVGDWFTSWNVHDIFEALTPTARLVTYFDLGASVQRDFTVRGGSNAYLHWRPTGGHTPSAVRVRNSAGEELPAHMAFWILRVQ